jgi:ABC-type spermidine/putrescine transport system permease subunit II
MDNEIVKRLAWSGLLAASSALASVVAARLAAIAWRRMFDEEPPE